MRVTSLLRFAVLPAALLTALPGGLAAQAVVVSAHQARTGWDAFASPSGLSVELATPDLGPLRAVGGYRWRRDTQVRDGTTCEAYWPRFEGCVGEPVETRVSERGWYLGAEVGVETGPVEVQAARLWGRTDPAGASRGSRTGRGAGDVFPEEATAWAAWRLGVRWRSPGGLPGGPALRVEMAPGVDHGGCVADAGAPLCGAEDVWALELGWAFTPRP